jgi:hypothetical protein
MPVDDAYTKVLLHFNGDDNGTVFTDESGKTWTRVSTPVTDTDIKKFGSAAGDFTVNNQHLQCANNAELNVGSSDFTIDCWVYFTSKTVNTCGLFSLTGESDTAQGILFGYAVGNGFLGLYVDSNGNGDWDVVSDADAWSADYSIGQWYHMALVRYGNSMYTYLDGVKINTYDVTGKSVHFGAGDHFINSGLGSGFVCHIEEFRFSVGIARWTGASFTPPTTEYIGAPTTYYKSAIEEIIFTELVAGGLISVDLIVDAWSIIDAGQHGLFYPDTLADVIVAVDAVSNVFLFIDIVAETISVIESVIDLNTKLNSISDAIMIWDTPMTGWSKLVADTLTVIDAVLKVHGIPVSEWLTLNEALIGNWDGVEGISESLLISDLAEAIRTILDTIADSITFADAVLFILSLQVLDNIHLFPGISIQATTNTLQEEILRLADDAKQGWDKLLEDAISMVDFSTVIWYLLSSITDEVTATDAVSNFLKISTVVPDNVTIAESLATQGTLYSLISELISFNISVTFDGEVWQCIVINNKEFDISVYSNFSFNSYCAWGKTAYGMKADGLYKLEGTTDQGTVIKAGVVFPPSNFGSEHKKHFRKAALGVSGTKTTLKVETETGDKIFLVSQGKATIDQALYGKDWTFSITEFETLDFLELIPIIMTR